MEITSTISRGGHLGKYRLRRRLGEGGSCEVWEARDTVEGILVAVKIPHVGVNGVRDNETLLREIRSVSKLRHPNILSVKNADVIGGHAVMATELCTSTLEDCSRPMSVKRIVGIMQQVLEGLAHAHRKRIVHCDVTPGNIFLLKNRRAVLGDFGICLEVKGRPGTRDDFGTCGYVAPEQAYGKPTYRSDVFAVGMILYEFITGNILQWPFDWPGRGFERLRERTSTSFVRFLRKSLQVRPQDRYANAGQMLDAMRGAIPRAARQAEATAPTEKKQADWRQGRRESFLKKYGRIFPDISRCVDCDEPISERMQVCPWCGSDRNRFDTRSIYERVCPRCHKGLAAEWRYCPWCFGGGFEASEGTGSCGVRSHRLCRNCGGKQVRFMRYCPWCNRKVRERWDLRPFPELCGHCGWAVDSEFWVYCPWCKGLLK